MIEDDAWVLLRSHLDTVFLKICQIYWVYTEKLKIIKETNIYEHVCI